MAECSWLVDDDQPPPVAKPEPTADTDLFLSISEGIAKARTTNDLHAVAKQLQDVKHHRSLPPEAFQRLRAAWARKRDEIERESEYTDAEYDDVEREAIAGEA